MTNLGKKELNDMELENVNGGMEITNGFGDCKTYYAGASSSTDYTFSFAAADKAKFDALTEQVWDDLSKKGSFTKAQFDAAVIGALGQASWATPISVKKNSVEYSI